MPRYAYVIASGYNSNIVGQIDIKFLKGTTNAPIDEVAVTISNTTGQGNWNVHPTFQNGIMNEFKSGEWNKDITGIWVAKFEAGYNISSPISTGIKYSYSNLGSNYYGAVIANTTNMMYPVFKPLTASYYNISVGDAYTLSKNLIKAGNPYNLSGVDSHLIKNSEWGAICYLAHSEYGRDGSNLAVNNLRIAAKSCYITGGTGNASDLVGVASEDKWNGEIGKNASTTGNVYGIYDMSGGSSEYVSGYISNGTAGTLDVR